MKQEHVLPPDGAHYEYDERDYDGELLGIDIATLPDVVVNDDGMIQDQNKAGYPMWCVHFSASMNDNYSNWRDKQNERSTGWQVVRVSPTFSPDHGDYINAWPKALLKLWHIEWYFTVSWLHNILYQIAQKNIIHVGSNTIDWGKTYRNNFEAVIGRGSWHAFQLIWYNNTSQKYIYKWWEISPYSLIAKNSYDSKPYFCIKFDDFDRALYPTKYYFVNTKKSILQHKKDIMNNLTHKSAKLTFLLWIWNGQDPKQNITREDANVMIYRALEKMWFDFTEVKNELEELEK